MKFFYYFLLRKKLTLQLCIIIVNLIFNYNYLFAREVLPVKHLKYPNTTINCLLQDSYGYIWIGTYFGLFRYDGFECTSFESSPRGLYSLSGIEIISLFEDKNKVLYIGTRDGGLCSYNLVSEKFTKYDSIIYSQLNSFPVYRMVEGLKNDLLVASYGGGIFSFSPEKKTIEQLLPNFNKLSWEEQYFQDLISNKKSGVWAIDMKKAYRIFIEKQKYVVKTIDLKHVENSNNILSDIKSDTLGNIWIYDNYGNFTILNINGKVLGVRNFETHKKTTSKLTGLGKMFFDSNNVLWLGGKVEKLRNISFEKDLLSAVTISDYSAYLPVTSSEMACNTFLEDHTGIIWVGTTYGLLLFDPNRKQFVMNTTDDFSTIHLPNNDVRTILEDKQNRLWIGTWDGGICIYDKKNSNTKFIKPKELYGASYSNYIWTLHRDSKDNIWVGSSSGTLFYLSVTASGIVKTSFCTDPTLSNKTCTSNDKIDAFVDDLCGNIWIGTWGTGIDIYSVNKRTFSNYSHIYETSSRLNANVIKCIHLDKLGNIWIGTKTRGLLRINFKNWQRTGKLDFEPITDKQSNSGLFCSINYILESRNNEIWCATSNGLLCYSPLTREYRKYSTENGLGSNIIMGILEDDNGKLWISTKSGISTFEPRTEIFTNYGDQFDIGTSFFNAGACYKASDGVMYFGSNNGLLSFRPENIAKNKIHANLFFTSLKINNKEILIGDKINGRVLLPENINETTELHLNYNENIISLSFAVDHYSEPEMCTYKYKLIGFDSDTSQWNYIGNKRSLTFTNLHKGKYLLQICSANNDGVWNPQLKCLSLKISPAPWNAWWAQTIYLITSAFAILAIVYFFYLKNRFNRNLELVKITHQKDKELNASKLNFFTNISHEFRTPLTLILGPIEDVVASGKYTLTDFHIYQNAQRLLRLINQILEIRKMEVGSNKLNLQYIDFVCFAKNCYNNFIPLSHKKKIQYSFNSKIEQCKFFFDPLKIENAIINLVSNAFTYTKQGGLIEINISEIFNNYSLSDSPHLNIEKRIYFSIKDTGIGLSPQDKHKVFEQFYRNDPKGINTQGAGIGLYLVKENIEVHNGSIGVKSELNKGSLFWFTLPVLNVSQNTDNARNKMKTQGVENTFEEDITDRHVEKTGIVQYIILIVDDNAEMINYVANLLKKEYIIIIASNAKEGLIKAANQQPDIIISDVMMPEISGIEFCERIKQNKNTSHIPVILLTAMATEKASLDGYIAGADDYIIKPFNKKILIARINNLIKLRYKLKEQFLISENITNPSPITNIDEFFLRQLIDLINENLSNESFDILSISKALNISRSLLYNKINALTGLSVNEFIIQHKLKTAAEILRKKNQNINEIAACLGFKSAPHFTKRFKDQFGIPPSEYRNKY